MAGTTFTSPFGGARAIDVQNATASWRGAGSETLLAAWQAFTNSGQIRVVKKVTTAQYNALTPDANTVYIVSD